MRPVVPLREEPNRHSYDGQFDPDECYFESFVDQFLQEYTRPGDLVLDPFAGAGTTLVVAERMDRKAIGLEIIAERVAITASRLADPSWVIEADARALGELDLPPVDFVITSPPYMTATHHPENPLTGYQTEDGDYRRYLAELTLVFRHVDRLLAPGGKVVVNAANLAGPDLPGFTPLAWDIASAVGRVLRFEREIVLDWEHPRDWFTNDYALIFGGSASTPQPNLPK